MMDPAEQAIALAGLKVAKDGFESIAATLESVRGIQGPEGPAGRDGTVGPRGESILAFRSGYDELNAWSADGLALFQGRAVRGTAEDDPGWWIERWPVNDAPDMLAVELPEGVREGHLRWSERESIAFRRSQLATRTRREMMARYVVDKPEQFLAELADLGATPEELAPLRKLLEEVPDQVGAYFLTGGVTP